MHVGSVFYSSKKPYAARHHYVNSIQDVGKRAIVSIVVLFSLRNITEKYASKRTNLV